MNATHLQNMFMPDTRRRDDWERSLGWFGVGIDRRTFRDDGPSFGCDKGKTKQIAHCARNGNAFLMCDARRGRHRGRCKSKKGTIYRAPTGNENASVVIVPGRAQQYCAPTEEKERIRV